MTEAYAVPVPKGYRVGVWEVREPIATGAFGSVYAARRVGDGTGLPPTAALKFLPTGTATPRRLTHLRELVEREVELYRRLRHPRLVRMYPTLTVDDPGHPDLDGATVLVLERAEGSLSALLAATPRPASGPALLAQIAEGLAQLHDAGWVHGDLEPANVLLMADGSVRLADFNMAAELEGTHACTPAFSTPDYTPPELLWSEIGERGRRIRPSADIWAFGVLAHQVHTGGLHPFPGATARARSLAAQSYARGTAPLRLDAGLDEDMRRLIADCLAPDHAARLPHTARGIAARVEAITGDSPRRRRRLVPAAAAGLVVLTAAAVAGAALLGGGVGTWDDDSDRDTPTVTGSPSPPAGEIPENSDVPEALRPVIARAAHRCTDEEITPALLAALIKAESNFDAKASRPESEEYGIAMWTPSVFRAWAVDGDGDGDKDHMSPPDAISTMSLYVCWLDQRFKQAGLPKKDLPALVAAGYRTSDRTVIEERGVPERVRPHVDKVMRYLAEYER